MKIFKYFLEFIFIVILFIIFKILGFKLASNMGGYIGKKIGPLFRSKQTILTNIKNALPSTNKADLELIIQSMWENYGRILAEYVFLKDFRKEKLNDFLEIEGKEHLNKLRDSNEQVVFVSGHFNNFELMAMQIEKSGIDLAAIYRPLNNIFLNRIMEKWWDDISDPEDKLYPLSRPYIIKHKDDRYCKSKLNRNAVCRLYTSGQICEVTGVDRFEREDNIYKYVVVLASVPLQK